MDQPREADLYPHVKRHLEALGYEVKGEVGAADVMAMRDGHEMLIVELKLGFSLSLLHQGVARQALSDTVYLCIPEKAGRVALRNLRSNAGLCKRLGLGLMTVRLRDGRVTVHCDPEAFKPRKAPRKAARLRAEFTRRRGDPNAGGINRRMIVTAYRQDATDCARYLAGAGASKGAMVAAATGVARATGMMADNHYGWFTRVSRGVYDLSDAGRAQFAIRDAAE
ncbi:hypothetical protein LCGC14_2023250 [marine sediment metagenome]|uniref:Uncharacterized protein n=1 Tax=marine sediment metagenome TaxID=412755 RepID=A0A0F9EWX2_9ZZZZ